MNSSLARFTQPPQPSRQGGISLIELMIALAISLLVLGALVMLFINNSNTRRELDRGAAILENGQFAINALSSELSLAGYYGTLARATGTTALPCSARLSDWSGSLAIHAYGNDDSVTDDLADCFSVAGVVARKAGTDAIVIQRASTCVAGPTAEAGCAAVAANRPYLQVSECGDEYQTTPFVLANGSNTSAIFSLRKRAAGSTLCAAAGSAPLRQFYRSIYYVDSANNLVRTDLIPGTTLTAASHTIASHIESLQLSYGFDTNGNGSPDVFGQAPISPGTWADAIGVRVWVLARAPSATAGYANTKTFVLDNQTVAPTDAYKRHVFSTYIPFTNPAGRRFQ